MFDLACYDTNTNKFFVLTMNDYTKTRNFMLKCYHSKHMYCLMVESSTNDTSELKRLCQSL